MNLLKVNKWRKFLIATFVLLLIVMFGIDWGYHFHVGHIVRLSVGFGAFWLVLDRFNE